MTFALKYNARFFKDLRSIISRAETGSFGDAKLLLQYVIDATRYGRSIDMQVQKYLADAFVRYKERKKSQNPKSAGALETELGLRKRGRGRRPGINALPITDDELIEAYEPYEKDSSQPQPGRRGQTLQGGDSPDELRVKNSINAVTTKPMGYKSFKKKFAQHKNEEEERERIRKEGLPRIDP